MQWQVSTMERTLNDSESGLEGVVNILHWQCTDSDGEHHGRCYGTVGLEAPDADAFTEWGDITHDDAVEWAKAALGDQVESCEASVANQIELSKNPVQASGTPWN
jgi:hypothetical protein